MLPIALSVVSGFALADDAVTLPAGLQEKVDAARNACSGFEKGTFHMEAGAIVRTDLNGDLEPDWVVNERYFACSSAASLYGNTGGSLSHFMVKDRVYSLLNQGWEMRNLGRNRILLAEVHGTQCDAYGYTPCFTAAVWDSEANTWRSAAATWDDK